MKKYFIKAIRLWLILYLIVSITIFSPMKAWAATNPVGSGKYIVDLDSDPATNIPSTFGSASDAGRIWTDKSVNAKTDGSFDINMSILGQEYMNFFEAQSAGGGTITNSLQADVVFILDLSTSMSSNTDIDNYAESVSGTYYKDNNGNYVTPVPSGYSGTRYALTKITRLQAMVDATNNAIDIIMASNHNNRVGVYWFGNALNTAHVGTFMSMGSYTLTSGTNYLDISGSTVSTNTNLEKDGTTYSRVSISTGPGTPTQDGIIYGMQSAIAVINAKANALDFSTYGKRQPFVFLLSDGAASIGNPTWWTTPSNPTTNSTYTNRSGSNLTGNTSYGSQTVAAATILTAAYQKSLITAAYKAYNLAGGKTTDYPTLFYSVGLGPNTGININGASETADTSTNYAWCALNPSGLISDYSYNGTVINKPTSPAATNTKSQIATYITNADNAGFADYAKYSITGTPGFVYSRYYFYAPSYPDLSIAFAQLSNDVANATKSVVLPVESYSNDSVTTTNGDEPVVVVSDKIGNNMELNGVPTIDTTAGIKDDTSSTETKTVYTFAGYDAIAATENNIIAYYIFPNDFIKHMYSFANSQNPVEGDYTSALPFRLSYNVKPSSLNADVTIDYYSNSFVDQSGSKVSQTVATFRPALSNPYYYYTNTYVGIVGGLNSIGQKSGGISGVKDSDITHYVKGTVVSDCTNFSSTGFSNVYVTYAMANVLNSPVTQSQIGTLININGADITGYSNDYITELDKTIYGCLSADSSDVNSANNNFAFLSGIVRSNDSLVVKSDNVTETANYSSETTFENGALTSKLGNNGILSILLGIDKKDVTGTAGSTQKYEIIVTNYTDSQQNGITVNDIAAFPGTATNTTESSVGASFNQTGTDISWGSFTIPAHSSITLSYTLQIPSGTSDGTEVTKDATLTYQEQSAVSEGKTTVTEVILSSVSINVNKDDTPWSEFTGDITLKDAFGNSITADNFDKVPDGDYTIFVDGTATNVSFTVDSSNSTSYTSTLNYYTLTLDKGAGISAVSGGGVFLQGAEVPALSATVNSGYTWDQWASSDTGLLVDQAQRAATFNMPAGSLSLTATATQIMHTITASAGANGSISPNGEVMVADGGDQAFTITPDAGYHINDVLVDGDSIGAAASYTFHNVTQNHTISATFELDAPGMHIITASAEASGSISPNGAVMVADGDDQAFTITPDAGYHISDVLVDGDSIGTTASYTFHNVTQNHTISVTFELDANMTHTITASAGANGSISPNGSVTVVDGDDQSFAITPNNGYHINDVLVDGDNIGTTASYTFHNITQNHTISVTFELDANMTHTITVIADAHGTISPSGPVIVNDGDSATFNISPKQGYAISDVKVDDVSVGSVHSYTFHNVTEDHVISASYDFIGDAPQTGDKTPIALLASIMAASLIGIITIVAYDRKQRRRTIRIRYSRGRVRP